jgi:predicted glycogen debranching enzyme
MEPIRRVALPEAAKERTDAVLSREWLVTNGIGGYASNTLAGLPTRRYHGILVAALPNPLGRMVMLTDISERVRLPDGSSAALCGEEQSGRLVVAAAEHLEEFRLEMGLPVWVYRIGRARIEKRLWMPYQQNTVFLRYRLLEGPPEVRLNLRPALNVRPVEEPVSTRLHDHFDLHAKDDGIEIEAAPGMPPLRMRLLGERTAFTIQSKIMEERLFPLEQDRGYEDRGDLWSPGFFRADMEPGGEVTLVASTEIFSTMLALAPTAALDAEHERRQRLIMRAPEGLRAGVAAELVLAADTFVVTPAYRAEEVAQRKAAGDELRSVIAGYHWFTDWGRDTMISLEGLTLATRRYREAGEILRTFARYARDGLIPNMFPNGSSEGAYNTVDATLWFFHALERYLARTGDQSTLRALLPTLRSIIDHHVRGTDFGIRVDPEDSLLTQGEEGVQLTWMDAKVDGWVVTPRRGKAVEINALWYNALRLMEAWTLGERAEEEALRYADLASRVREAFNRRFWFREGGYLYDIVDGDHGDDPSLRPNQLFAISLDHPVLDRSRWSSVLTAATEHLLTPVGLRSLAPGSPDYKPNYHGDLRTRDAAYHQGTVWGWLIGPYVDAWLKVHPEDHAGAREHLLGLIEHLDEFGVGSLAEIFDAEPPFTARGCIAQAWSVAEVLRCWDATRSPAPDPA